MKSQLVSLCIRSLCFVSSYSLNAQESWQSRLVIQDESGNLTYKKDNDGNLSLRWISDDAVAACKIATIESGKNKFAEYFKKRVWSYMILVILLFILLTGNITIFTNLALKAVNGVLKVIGAI